MNHVLVTGASGFVGSALLPRLRGDGHRVTALTRRATPVPGASHTARVSFLGDESALAPALRGVDAVVHLAARVHVMRDTVEDPLAEFRRVNVAGTLGLARAAASAGVRRFVFLSSIKVNGEEGYFRESDTCSPHDPYGISKHEAELGLKEIESTSGMEIVIIRPPLVYGPGVRANFRSLIQIVRRGIPLPLGAVRNRRSMVGVRNLADCIVRCLDHPAAGGETFFVSDGEDLSTPELIRRLARAMGRRPLLIPIPVPILAAGATLLGKRDILQRLTGSLQVDITKARTLLDWSPPFSIDEELRRAISAP